MERAEILRKLMTEKNMKVSDIVRITGIPYSTIKSDRKDQLRECMQGMRSPRNYY